MGEEKTVTLAYASSHNITFRGTIETEIPVSEWNEMTEDQKDEIFNETVWDLVEMWEIEDPEDAELDW